MMSGEQVAAKVNAVSTKISNYWPKLPSSLQPGHYPVGYNPRVHGPYDPRRRYDGKVVQRFSSLKVGEIPSWLFSRELSPRAMFREMFRKNAAFMFRWHQPKQAKLVVIVHFYSALAGYYYFLGYAQHVEERHVKHHW